MTDSVSFKAYLKRDGQEVEVRRFGVDGGAASSYLYLRSKIQATFPSIQNDQFQIFWQDSDKDYIRMDSDEELLEALTSCNQQPVKIYVQIKNTAQGGAGGSGTGDGRQEHPGVVCDGCEGAVVGFHYKCVTCRDFDLCSSCENKGLHTEHFMLRMPTPMNSVLHHPKFLRKLFSHPHKFHKRHGWSRLAPAPRGCGDSQFGAGRCPFSQPGEGPAGPAAAFAGVADMFDFSALMEFIESLGVAKSEERTSQTTNTTTPEGPTMSRCAGGPTMTRCAANSNGTTQNVNQGPSCSQSFERSSSYREKRRTAPATEYLNNIGQMVAAILDPFGVDVSFDVRTGNSSDQQQQNAGATSSNATAPAQAATAPAPSPVQATTAPAPSPVQATTAPAPSSSSQATTAPAPFPAQATTAPAPFPAQATTAPTPFSAQPTAAPTPFSAQPTAAPTAPVPEPEVPATSSQTESILAATIETQTETVRERRNSDDWTMINRESPTRSEATAMEVDESRGAKPKTPPPATASPSAPPHNDDFSEVERRRIQEAIETFRSMGFNFNTNNLQDMLKRQNFDMLSVLETMLSAEKK